MIPVTWTHFTSNHLLRCVFRHVLVLGEFVVLSALVGQGITADGARSDGCHISTSMRGFSIRGCWCSARDSKRSWGSPPLRGVLQAHRVYQRPIVAGVVLARVATIATWFIAIAVVSAVNAPALDIQASAGLLVIVVMLVMVNWCFHTMYWTGWISPHNRGRRLTELATDGVAGTIWGFVLLGFCAMYREGFEVVLFLQSLRLQVGSGAVLHSMMIGAAFTIIVGVLTFVVQRKVAYKKMLVLTGMLLGLVLVVMVGERAQELQLSAGLTTTPVSLPG